MLSLFALLLFCSMPKMNMHLRILNGNGVKEAAQKHRLCGEKVSFKVGGQSERPMPRLSASSHQHFALLVEGSTHVNFRSAFGCFSSF